MCVIAFVREGCGVKQSTSVPDKNNNEKGGGVPLYV